MPIVHTMTVRLTTQTFVILASLLLAACAPRWEPPPGYRGGILMGSPPPQRIVVQQGDSVFLIAQRFNVPMQSIIDANGLEAPYVIYPGQVLRLIRPFFHTVVPGESLSIIAQRYGVDMRGIAASNGIAPPYVIFPGQELIITGAAAPAVANAPSSPRRGTTRPPDNSRAGPSRAAPVESTPPAVASAPPPARASGRFAWPVNGQIIASFGPAGKGLHNDGINIAVANGTPVRAAENGVVAYSGNELQGFGNLLLIKHADGWMSAYAHNSELLVQRGDRVNQGQVISRSGASGSVRTPQLHFELRRGTEAVDPLRYLASQQS